MDAIKIVEEKSSFFDTDNLQPFCKDVLKTNPDYSFVHGFSKILRGISTSFLAPPADVVLFEKYPNVSVEVEPLGFSCLKRLLAPQRESFTECESQLNKNGTLSYYGSKICNNFVAYFGNSNVLKTLILYSIFKKFSSINCSIVHRNRLNQFRGLLTTIHFSCDGTSEW